MISSITKRNGLPPAPRPADEIYPAEVESVESPAPSRRPISRSKLPGAYLTTPEITGVILFFFAGGGAIGHFTQATSWGGEFAVAGLIVGICLGTMGREKIRGVFKRWFSRFGKASRRLILKSIGRNGSNGLSRMPSD